MCKALAHARKRLACRRVDGQNASFAVSRHVYGGLGPLIGGTVGVLVVCSLLFFRSVFVAIRLVITMAWTVAASFTVSVLVFTAPTRLDSDYMPALHWFVPVVGFTLMTAITLDYDGFVVSRVIEERLKPGVSDQIAVIRAVDATGSVISFAGIIMTIAFGSLVLSSMLLLRQFAVVIAVSVLLDTFLVRPIFVPALLAVASRWAWWPRQMPSVDDSPEPFGVNLD